MPVPVHPNDPRLIEAMEHFESYSQQELARFLRGWGLLIGGLIKDQRDRIRHNIEKGEISLGDAFDYIDRLEEYGYQTIFLYRPVSDVPELLDRLGDPEQLRSCLSNYAKTRPAVGSEDGKKSECDCPTLLETLESIEAQQDPDGDEVRVVSRFVYCAPRLEIAGVYLRAQGGRQLVLKFVETRHWTVLVPNNGGFNTQKRIERSANYFWLNLENGRAEIRLRTLQPRPLLSLHQELDLYVAELQTILSSFPFVGVLLEGVIRRLLTSRGVRLALPRLNVTQWSVDVAGEGLLAGGVNPGFVQKVLLAFKNYTAVRLSGDWELVRGGLAVRASLDGKTNAVGLPKRYDEEQVTAVLQKIMGQKQRRLHIEAIRQLAKKKGAWLSTLSKYDLLFHDNKIDAVTVEKMADDTWTPLPEAREVAAALRDQYPEEFQVTYYVRCPDTGRRVRRKGVVARFRSPAEVPEEITCDHARPKRELRHDTAGIVEAELTYKRRPDVGTGVGVLPLLSRFLHKKLPSETAELAFPPIAWLLFLALFIAVIGGATWVFSALAERFSQDKILAYLGFFLVLFLGTGIVVKALGPPATEIALKVFPTILEAAKTALGFGSEKKPLGGRVEESNGKKGGVEP